MSGSERLDELNSAALAIINDSEGQVLDLERRVEELRSRLDIERRQISKSELIRELIDARMAQEAA